MRRAAGLLRLGLAGLMISLVVPSGLVAQSLEESELQYREALTFYDAVSANRDVVANQFYALLDSLTTAREAADQNRVDALEGRFRDVGVELSRLDIRLGDAEQAYETARAALLGSLDQRLDSLGTVAEMSADPALRESIGRMIFDLQVQYAQVAAEELEETIGPPSMMLPAFRVDPRDTPSTLRAKAEFLAEKAADFEREIERVDQLLEGYQRELRLERFTGDARASIDRFGDTQVPVRGSAGAARAEQGIAADTLGVDLESLAPEDAISRLQAWRAQLVLARDGTLAALENIRNEIRGTPEPESAE
jgi:hypothetical protein